MFFSANIFCAYQNVVNHIEKYRSMLRFTYERHKIDATKERSRLFSIFSLVTRSLPDRFQAPKDQEPPFSRIWTIDFSYELMWRLKIVWKKFSVQEWEFRIIYSTVQRFHILFRKKKFLKVCQVFSCWTNCNWIKQKDICVYRRCSFLFRIVFSRIDSVYITRRLFWF